MTSILEGEKKKIKKIIMAVKMKITIANFFIPILIFFIANDVVISDDTVPIPPDKGELKTWFENNVKPLSDRKSTLDPALVAAEGGTRTIRVRKDGKGDFKTVQDAVNSIPKENTKRVIVYIGPGEYKEKIKIDRTKPFVTFLGNPRDMPKLVFDGTALTYGTVDSATLIVESEYFVAANIIIANSALRPDGKRKGAQAVALRLSGDKTAIYNSKIYGFQDTLCDDAGKHFFKDCYIEGTVDFIFGDGRSLYVNTEIHVLSGDNIAIITAQAGKGGNDPGGYSFAHCQVTGTGGIAYLGRAWMPYPEVIFSYTEMSDVVHPEGWSNNFNAINDKTVLFGEYQCTGVGANHSKRAGFTKKLSAADVKPYLNLGYVEASKWLLPPPSLTGINLGSSKK